MQQDVDQPVAMKQLGQRGEECVYLHFGMDMVNAKYTDRFQTLFGRCFGGSNYKHTAANFRAKVTVADPRHPICRGIREFDARNEFYNEIKFVKPPTHLIQTNIDGK